MKRLLLLIFLFCFSYPCWAVNYYWKLDLNGNVQPEIYSDGVAACASLNQRFAGNGRNYYGKVVSSINVECWDQVGYTRYNGSRFGDSCPAGTEFDPLTTKCVTPPNPCADKPPMPFSKSGTAPDGYMTIFGKNSAPATEGCFGGCLASTTDQKCTTKTSGSYFCRGTAYFSGQACASGTPGVDQSDSSARPDPQTTSDEKPCNYVTNPDGTQSCESSKTVEQEGQACGTISATGEKICVDKPPTKNGVDIATKVETKTNADGTKETTKTDTATSTKCTGILTCTSSTTTVSKTVKIDANGNTTSATGSCTGANCPDKNTNPDGNGDGFGDCVSGDCGDGDGDGGGPSLPGLDDVDSYQTTTQKFYDKVKGSPVATSVNSISVPDNGAPPNFKTGSIAFLGGVSLDFGIIGELWAGVADVLHLVMRAVWCFVAVVIFLMA